MSPQPSDLVAQRLTRLEAIVAQLDERVQVLETQGSAARTGTSARSGAPVSRGVDVGIDEADLVGTLSLIGRTFVVFAGAYLLRALTDGGMMPAAAGAVAGVAYAAALVVAADRAAAAGKRISGTFHTAAAVAIAFPLLAEVTVRFGLLSPGASAVTVGLWSGALLWVAWRRDLHVGAWLVTTAGLATSVALMVRTGAVPPFAGYLIGLGIVTLWLGYDRGWKGLRWPVGVVADLAVVGTTSRALQPVPIDPVPAALALQVLLPTAYLGSIAARTLWLGRNVIPFEVVQATAALAIGVGGAVALTTATGVGTTAVGLSAAASAIASYAVAFAFIDRRQGRGVNFYFYTTLGLVFLLTAAASLLPAAPRALTLAGLGVCAAWVSSRFSRAALTAHAAVLIAAAALVGGVLTASWDSFVSRDLIEWPPATAAGWLVGLAATCALWLAHHPDPGRQWHPVRLPRSVLAVLAVMSLGGLFLAATAPSLVRLVPSPFAAAAVAVVRTGVLAAAALLLALLGRHPRNVELRLLLYPTLALAGVKLLVEDLVRCPPSLLVVALSLYGVALIVAPRLARRTSEPRPVHDVQVS